MLADSVVDWGALLEVVWTSLVGGIGVTAIFAVAILGATRAVDLRQAGNPAAARRLRGAHRARAGRRGGVGGARHHRHDAEVATSRSSSSSLDHAPTDART